MAEFKKWQYSKDLFFKRILVCRLEDEILTTQILKAKHSNVLSYWFLNVKKYLSK